MGNFIGQDNDPLTDLLTENYCESRIVPHNLTDRFQPLDISVNKLAKAFISNKYSTWFSDIVFTQLLYGIDPAYIDISTKINTLKPLYARWICELYGHLRGETEIIAHGFEKAGISEAIEKADDMVTKIENPFRA